MGLAALVSAGVMLALGRLRRVVHARQAAEVDRATLPLTRIDTEPVSNESAAAPATEEATTESTGAATMPAAPVAAIPGTYTFTIPPTVTSVKATNSGMQQYRLFLGQPAAGDTPFVVITVAPDQTAQPKPTPTRPTAAICLMVYQPRNGRDMTRSTAPIASC